MDPLTLTLPAAATCAATALFVRATFSPRSNLWGPVIHQGNPARPRFALTFDDGPTLNATDRILDTLGELNAKAAFFFIGQNVRRAPGLVRRAYDEGHLVANHSLDHSHFGIFGLRHYWEQQLRETDDAIAQIIGRRPALFRPPMGIRTGHCANASRRSGHTMIMWSRRAVDGLPTTTPRIVDRLVPATRPGDILLLHDGVEPNLPRRDPAPTVAAIKPLILALRERGLEPAPLDPIANVTAYQTGELAH
jgi:peptidoglycan/xylan/chitin deacetylase (PgdA/CDA1 family)